MSGNTLYDKLKAAGVEIDSHESDLYCLHTDVSFDIVKNSGHSFNMFRSERDGKKWIEIPFAYAPWWRARGFREDQLS